MTEAPKPTSKARASVFIKAAMEALDAAGGSLPLREVKKAVAERVILDAHDLAQYESSGHVRWESVLHFYSIDAVKAGFIRKSDGRDLGLVMIEQGLCGRCARHDLLRTYAAAAEKAGPFLGNQPSYCWWPW